METIQWKVEGMTCSNCALTISKYLQKQGQQNVQVNPIDGDVIFDTVEGGKLEDLKKGISSLGYTVVNDHAGTLTGKRPLLHNNMRRFLFCLPFTLVLMLHMLGPWVHFHWLMNPWVQLAICLPVFILGMSYFGRSAIQSLRNGLPNMNVLVALGASAAFAYSLAGTLLHLGEGYLFYETAATIITLVFLGNYLEDASVQGTQRALQALVRSQKVMANMIAFDGDHQEVVLPLENTQLKVGDLILIRTGEQVPIDCKILWGDAHVNEAILTGESTPLHKQAKDKLIGGSVLDNGTVKAQVIATGNDTVLASILTMVKKAQAEKPPVQLLADRISAIFVPVVIGIAGVTLAANWLVLKDFTPALMRSIAVLVISCPCAMGLATPAAIAVGLGRGARSGILFRNAASLEAFKDIRQVVFDKTGTLTTGAFTMAGYQSLSLPDDEFRRVAWSLEKYSTHPLARAITHAFKGKDPVRWEKIGEIKGLGMKALDKDGNTWMACSRKGVQDALANDNHNVYITRNDEMLGWIDVEDELRPESQEIVNYLHGQGIRTILLSGDRKDKCEELAARLGIDEVLAEQTPEQKLERVTALTADAPTAMVGDGINDAPALAKATIGISLSDASQLAMQSAQVVLMNHGLKKLPEALGLGRHTYMTIRQNLFWAFLYNIVAIPIAALGYLQPSFSALAMGLSDVVLAVNSIRLFVKKVI
jgi:P-type Cu+ transporter